MRSAATSAAVALALATACAPQPWETAPFRPPEVEPLFENPITTYTVEVRVSWYAQYRLAVNDNLLQNGDRGARADEVRVEVFRRGRASQPGTTYDRFTIENSVGRESEASSVRYDRALNCGCYAPGSEPCPWEVVGVDCPDAGVPDGGWPDDGGDDDGGSVADASSEDLDGGSG